mmetsp:Transcript_8977/g.23405  ORF Transcript_8977/g.23405 Transcript_8977/m.23405 type:complete len:307 (-) Transcript_8977:97-1017(-)
MGARCSGSTKELEHEQDDFVHFQETHGSIRILIVALNYEYSKGAELTCTKDAKTMFRIADRAGVEDITVLTDKAGVGARNFPTRSVVLAHVRSVAERCEPGDWFVWFFAGHGANVPDYNGDEKAGFDQAFVTPDRQGALTEAAALIDDEFALALDRFVPEGVRILCICDCCHSGTICDIDSFAYRHEIYQISASLDDQEAEDVGNGGVLTIALRRAVRSLSLQRGSNEFSIQSVFDKCKKRAERLTREQDFSFQWQGTDPSLMAWPMCYSWLEYLTKPHFRTNIHGYEEDDSSDGSNASSDEDPLQ